MPFFFIVIGLVLYDFYRNFKMEYIEYKTEYIRFYVISYIENNALTDSLRTVNSNGINELAARMYEESHFDLDIIADCISDYSKEIVKNN